MRGTLLVFLILGVSPARAATPQESIAAVLADVQGLPPHVSCCTRYLVLPSQDALLRVVRAWPNFLSREVEFALPRPVGAGVLAVRLDDYQWDPKVWENQFNDEPFFFFLLRYYWPQSGKWYLTKEGKEIVGRTHSCVPIVYADWWLFYSSRQIDLDNRERGHGYYDWLGIVDQKAFEKLRFTDRKVAIKIGDELRAVLEEGRSKVSQKDRRIDWLSTYGDGEFGLWFTEDADDTSKDNTVVGNLENGGFKGVAREGFIGLPNSLIAVYAGDNKGQRQTFVPPQIAADTSPYHRGNDRRIHQFSCFHCHNNGGLQPVDDWARQNLRVPNELTAFKLEDLRRLKRQFFRDLDVQLAKGRKRYSEALRTCSGHTPERFAADHAAVYYGYLRMRSRSDVAAILGITEECLAQELKRFFDPRNPNFAEKKRLAGLLPLTRERRLFDLSPWAESPNTIPTAYLEKFSGDILCIVGGHK